MREFPMAMVLLLGTGTVFQRGAVIDELQEAFDYVLGFPIMTHHLAVGRLWDAMKTCVLAQHPDVFRALPKVTKENAELILEETRATFGDTLPLAPMPEGLVEPPWLFEGIPEGKPVLLVDPVAGTVEETLA